MAGTAAPGSVRLIARMDWSSPSAHYIGAGTYLLRRDEVCTGQLTR